MSKRLTRSVILVAWLGMLTGCATTTLVGTWSDAAYTKRVQKILVLGMSQNEAIKRTYESTLSQSLRAQGVQADAAASVLPEGTPTTADGIKGAIAGKGYDTILVTRLVSRETEQRYVPGTAYHGPYGYYNGFNAYYANAYPAVYSPGYLVNDTVVNLETNIYETTDGKLVWSVMSESFNPSDINKEIQVLSDVLVKRMKKDGLL